MVRYLSVVSFVVMVSFVVAGQEISSSSAAHSVSVHKETIVVTGTYQPISLDEADRVVEPIDLNDRRALYNSWVDPPRLDPSVDIRQRAPGAQADLSIRGSSFQQTLVLVDGLRVNDAQSGHHNLDLPVPFTSMDRIEVLHGSGSTLYGSDALGGAVNFVTTAPVSSEIVFGGAGGNYGSNQQYGAASFSSKRFSERLSFDRDFSSGFIEHRDYRNLALSSESHVNTVLGKSSLLFGLTDRPFGADQFYGNFNSWERTKGWFLGASHSVGNTQVGFGYRRHTDDFVLFRDQPSVYENNHITESYQLALRRHDQLSRRAILFYGAEGYRDVIDSNNLGYHGRNQGAAYLDLKVDDLKRFTVSVGARGEAYSGNHSQVSPSVAIGYRASNSVRLKTSLDHAFRLPTYTDLFYRDPANIGNPNLKPEHAWGFESGIVWSPNDRVWTEATFFTRWERDGIDYVRPDPQSVWQAANIDRVRFIGAEVSSHISLRRSRTLIFGYTGIYGAQSAAGTLQSKYVRNYPRHQASAGWTCILPGKLDLQARLGVTDRYQQGAYPLAELALRRSYKMIAPFLRLTNLTNTGYAEIDGVRMPGRSVLAGLEFHLSRELLHK